MESIFQALYKIHPVLPVVYLALLANGLLAPAVYCAIRGLPYDLIRIWTAAKTGSAGARYALTSQALILALTAVVLVL